MNRTEIALRRLNRCYLPIAVLQHALAAPLTVAIWNSPALSGAFPIAPAARPATIVLMLFLGALRLLLEYRATHRLLGWATQPRKRAMWAVPATLYAVFGVGLAALLCLPLCLALSVFGVLAAIYWLLPTHLLGNLAVLWVSTRGLDRAARSA